MKGLPYAVQSLLQKTRDSALLAVETYNRPSASFRSGAYIVLMVIAWTSLFHAMFLKKKIKPYYRKQGSKRYQKIDGDYRWWELAECLRQHYKDQHPPIRKNVEFIIGLRNKIEHRSLPKLDTEIFGECQALLLNLEAILCDMFGERYAIRGGLSFALQFSPSMPKGASLIKTGGEDKELKNVREFIDGFRSALSTEIQSDLAYSFKVFLVPKIGSHASKDSLAIEFVKYDPAKPQEMDQYEKIVALIKPKEVRVANLNLLKPGEVVSRVAKALGKSFNMHHHVVCYRHFNARPPKRAADPKACDSRYCIYDAAHRDYLYTEEWVEHLIKSLSDTNTYKFLVAKKNEMIPATASSSAAV